MVLYEQSIEALKRFVPTILIAAWQPLVPCLVMHKAFPRLVQLVYMGMYCSMQLANMQIMMYRYLT